MVNYMILSGIFPWVVVYLRVGEGQGDGRVLCGRVSSKRTQGFRQPHPGAALWTVNSGGRTQRPLSATRYDDDGIFGITYSSRPKLEYFWIEILIT